jgi:hypothetical protein
MVFTPFSFSGARRSDSSVFEAPYYTGAAPITQITIVLFDFYNSPIDK